MAAKLVHRNADLHTAIAGERSAFVPTMGALHEGHLALIRKAAEFDGPVVVSIFVNPTQFAPGEDFNRYPRTLQRDVPAAERAGATVIYAPSADQIYPSGNEPAVPPLPPVATQPGLEDAFRTGHFAGVCQVVARLFDIVKPRWTVFGEKDYQQLLVIRAMVHQSTTDAPDRWPGLEIISHPTVREPDGLAMSSRNQYLSARDRNRALGLSRALESAGRATTPNEAEAIMHEELAAHCLQVDYAAVRDALTLDPIDSFNHPARALIAARLNDVRLIDNCGVGPRSALVEGNDQELSARDPNA